jgi:hypothetical protein
MGANSKQGWCLFAFLVGFTCLPAGLAYLGTIFTLIGLILLIGSLVGFYQLKPLEYRSHVTGDERASGPSMAGGKRA